MKRSEGHQVESSVTLDGIVRSRLQAVRAPSRLHDRVRALIAAEFRDDTSSDREWRE